MKKVLSIVLSIAMVVCLAPTMAFAATTNAQSNAAYSDITGTACEGAVNVLSARRCRRFHRRYIQARTDSYKSSDG